MALSGINGRRGPWFCEGLKPHCRGILGRWGGSGQTGGGTPSWGQGEGCDGRVLREETEEGDNI